MLPALSAVHLVRAETLAAALLRTLGMPHRLRAWDFLPDMLALTVVHPPLLNDLTHGLYPLLARRCGMSAAAVERSLRLCVESIWSRGSIDAQERFFGHSVDPERGKPTNREFLCRMQERLTFSLRRIL
jgi:two-component system response regulator (stage 0 sporulation protein A)